MKNLSDFDNHVLEAISKILEKDKLAEIEYKRAAKKGHYKGESYFVMARQVRDELELRKDGKGTAKARRSLDKLYERGLIARSKHLSLNRYTMPDLIDSVYDVFGMQMFEKKEVKPLFFMTDDAIFWRDDSKGAEI